MGIKRFSSWFTREFKFAHLQVKTQEYDHVVSQCAAVAAQAARPALNLFTRWVASLLFRRELHARACCKCRPLTPLLAAVH